jgi:predicted transcriptional regulator
LSAAKLLLSIRPQYANKIFGGTKTVELRRIFPRAAQVDTILVYITSPVKALAGIIEVERVVMQHPPALWRLVKDRAGVTYKEFEAYYAGASLGYGIFFRETWEFPEPIHLDKLREKWAGFWPPQMYHYLTDEQVKWACESARISSPNSFAL